MPASSTTCAGCAREPGALEEVAVVAAAEEAGLLALGGARRRRDPRLRLAPASAPSSARRAGTRAAEQVRVDRGEHVALVLRGVDARARARAAVALDDPRVVAGRKPRRADAVGEGDELVEAEAAVATHARVRRRAGRVTGDEGLDDRAAELLAQVESDVREPARVAGRARLDHGRGRAAGALGVAAVRIDPEPERDADRGRGPASSRATALSTPPLIATATRSRVGCGRDDRPDRVRERVDRERLAADRRRLEQRQAREVAVEARRVRTDDSLAVDPQANRCPLVAACRIAEESSCSRRELPSRYNRNAPTPPSVYARVNLASQVGAVAWLGRSRSATRGPLTRRIGST